MRLSAMAPSPRKKGTKSPQEAARSAFRDEVRLAAERVFATKGFGATKMADIAAEAQVGVGTLYNYFANKQEIFEAIFLSRAEQFQTTLDNATVGLLPLEQVSTLIRASMLQVEEHGALFSMFFERGGIGELDIERLGGKVIEELYQSFLRRLEDAISGAVKDGTLRDDIPVSTMVAMLAGARNGALYAWLKGRRRGRIADSAENLLTLFLSGARATS
jgi:AcrR family transcriptional regulator